MAGAHILVITVRGTKCDGRSIFMSLLAGMVTVGGRPQLVEVSEGPSHARLCARVKHSTLNSAIHKEMRHRGTGQGQDRVNATRPACRGSVLVNPFIQRFGQNLKKKY